MNQTLHEGFKQPVQSAYSFIEQQVGNYQQKQIIHRQRQSAVFKQFVGSLFVIASATALSFPQLTAAENAQRVIIPESPVFQSSIQLDKESPAVWKIDQPVVEIKVGQSIAQAKAKAKATKSDQVTHLAVPSNVRRSLTLEQARQKVKDAANQAGIPDQWRYLEAIWQKETGKSDNTCIKGFDGVAYGPMQFVRGTFESHKAKPDANICNTEDALAAAADLLKDGGVEHNVDKAIHNYNHSMAYVRSVKQIADSIQ